MTFNGRHWALIDTVIAAERVGPRRRAVSLRRQGGGIWRVVVGRVGPRIASIYSASPERTVFVSEGMDTRTGKPTMSDKPCNQAVPVS